MLCRGYGKHSHLFLKKKGIRPSEWTFLGISLGFIVLIPVVAWLKQVSWF
jgi:energy-coupling factor transporter transmembrane protein EcfT